MSDAPQSESPSTHVSLVIDRSPQDVYAYASDPRNLPAWAPGLAASEPRFEVDSWSIDSPMGRILVRFTPDNPYGVLDHMVTLSDGESIHNPMRVLPIEDGKSEVLFTVRRGGMSEEQHASDVAAVREDLETLRRILEHG